MAAQPAAVKARPKGVVRRGHEDAELKHGRGLDHITCTLLAPAAASAAISSAQGRGVVYSPAQSP
eukprot:1110232-Prymnesium_polylepis.1